MKQENPNPMPTRQGFGFFCFFVISVSIIVVQELSLRHDLKLFPFNLYPND